jgi:phosphate transport system permease protein
MKRKWWNRFMCMMLGLATLIALYPLVSVFLYLFEKGWSALTWEFFTELPKPVGETGGGMANALWGTAVLVALASVVSIPWGIGAGMFLSEYGSFRPKVSAWVRFFIDILASTPSILVGLFVYSVVVIQMKRFSANAGGIALGILMIPTVARSTEEFLKLVPSHIREAGLALGLPRWKVTLQIILKGSMGAIATGIVLAIARASGETAPLLFTAFNNRFWNRGLDQPIASLPVQIYTYAISPYEDWHRQAWGGALVLLAFVFLVNLITRLLLVRSGRSTE